MVRLLETESLIRDLGGPVQARQTLALILLALIQHHRVCVFDRLVRLKAWEFVQVSVLLDILQKAVPSEPLCLHSLLPISKSDQKCNLEIFKV